MDTVSRKTLLGLLHHPTATCASIYMPTHPTGPDGQQDPVRLQHLLQQIEDQLVEGGMRSVEVIRLLQPARDLAADSGFWKKRSLGLAAFVSTKAFHRFRLPRRFEELAVVHNRFHVKPLLPLVADVQRFFVLALSQNDVRLFEASQFQIEQLEVDGLPTNMKDALNYTSVDRGSQVHPAMKGSGGLGKQGVVFHGQGGEADTHKAELTQYLRQVDAAIRPLLSAAPAPLLLAGVAYLLPIYRGICRYSGLAEVQLEGNCDYLSPTQILERAFPVIEPILEQNRKKVAERYVHLVGTSHASDDITQIIAAAHDGRVDTLFVNGSAHLWGNIHNDRTVEVHHSQEMGDDDLLDLAAAQTLLHRGTVYSLDSEQLPNHRIAAAVFRY